MWSRNEVSALANGGCKRSVQATIREGRISGAGLSRE